MLPAFLLAALLTAEPPILARADDVPGDVPAVERAERAGRVERQLTLMGTELALVVEAPDRRRALAASERALRALEAAERRLSTWGQSGGELARLNQTPVGEKVRLSPELARELAGARRCFELTGGAFDPGIGALLAAWDVRGRGRVPTPAERAQAVSAAGFDHLELVAEDGGTTAIRRHPGLVIEEGGFGKGAGLDRAAEALADPTLADPALVDPTLVTAGPVRALLNLGGQLLAVGGGPAWTVPVADPRDRGRPVLALELGAGSVATSGNSERGFWVEGVRHSHILDPRSGEPAADFGSLTVVAPDGLGADCLATGLYVLGPRAALDFAAGHAGIEVLALIVDEGRGLTALASAGLAGHLESLDEDVQIVFPTENKRGGQVASSAVGRRPAAP